MTTLLKMCCESGCEKILINDKWVGKENQNYQSKVEAAEGITYGYCDEHLNNNSSQRQLVELRRMRADGLM